MRHRSSSAALVVVLALATGLAARAEESRLPADEESAKARLDTSPRHGEMARVDVAGTSVRTWVVYPERSDKAPVVVVIHEIFGLTDWIRGVADQLAGAGFIAVAPDLLSGTGPGGGGTESYASRDDATRAVSDLVPRDVHAKLSAVRNWALALPAANGKTASIGFCWGGMTSFAWATAEPALDAAVVYYGTGPDAAALGALHAPVLGLYGGDDARVGATLDATRTRMKELGKTYEVHEFPGAGHGFLRAQQGQGGANRTAAEQAWPLTLAFLRQHTR